MLHARKTAKRPRSAKKKASGVWGTIGYSYFSSLKALKFLGIAGFAADWKLEDLVNKVRQKLDIK